MAMIVDDNPRMRGLVKRYIQNIRARIDFCECANGLEPAEQIVTDSSEALTQSSRGEDII